MIARVVLAIVFGFCFGAMTQSALAEGDAPEVQAKADASHEHSGNESHKDDSHAGDFGHDDLSHANAGKSVYAPEELKKDLAIYTFITFLLLLGILWKFAWGPISEGLHKREQAVADNIAAAEEANEEAHRLTADYEAKLQGAADEVREMIEEARRDADVTRQQIVEQAQADAAREVDRATREINVAKDAALKDLGTLSANLAVNLAGEIVRRELQSADHADLIKTAMANLPTDPSNN